MRDGKPRERVVVPLGKPDDGERPQGLRPDTGLASMVGGWPGSDELVGEIEATDRTSGREVPDLE